MLGKINPTFSLLIIGLFVIGSVLHGQENTNEGIMKAHLRKIGHELLLLANDSTSRVLPIEKKDGVFRVGFASEFQLNPENLTTIINSELKDLPIINNYLVEVQSCNSKEVVYSYQYKTSDVLDRPSCGGRLLPKACYNLVFTIWESKVSISETSFQSNQKMKWILIGVFISISLGVSWFLFQWKKKRPDVEKSTDLIGIGSFQFDPIQMKLIHPDGEYELTGKEVDLLAQLYNSVNQIVDRDVILKTVWGDEGDYIGRTLDVFISKLRKKLEADSTVRILNIRGVGYKLVVG